MQNIVIEGIPLFHKQIKTWALIIYTVHFHRIFCLFQQTFPYFVMSIFILQHALQLLSNPENWAVYHFSICFVFESDKLYKREKE